MHLNGNVSAVSHISANSIKHVRVHSAYHPVPIREV